MRYYVQKKKNEKKTTETAKNKNREKFSVRNYWRKKAYMKIRSNIKNTDCWENQRRNLLRIPPSVIVNTIQNFNEKQKTLNSSN